MAEVGKMSYETERRQENRAAIELKVEYQRLNSFFFDYAKNISKGGTFIRTRRPLEVGTKFLFKLVVPTMHEPFVLGGEVRWVQRDGDARAPEGNAPEDPGMGIRFLFEDRSHKEIVDRQVERMMIASLGQLIYARLKELLA